MVRGSPFGDTSSFLSTVQKLLNFRQAAALTFELLAKGSFFISLLAPSMQLTSPKCFSNKPQEPGE